MATEEKPPLGREKGTPWGEDIAYGGLEYGRAWEFPRLDIAAIDKMLRRDGKAKALEDVLTLPLRSANWEITPAEGDSGQAEQIRAMLTRPAAAGGMSTPIGQVIAQATSAITYSKAFFEKVFKIHGGQVVYDKIASRPVSTCELGRDPRHGTLAGFRQHPWTPDGTLQPDENSSYLHIPPKRSWVYVHGAHRDPLHGVSDMLVPLWCHETKIKVLWLWFLFAENTALPRAVVTGRESSQAKKTAKNFAQMKGGAAIAVDKDTNIDPYESNSQGHQQYRALMEWLDDQMTGSVLASFMNLPAKDSGSWALSKDQSDLFVKARMGVARELAESVTNNVVADLAAYNWGADAPRPRFEFTSLLDVDVDQALSLLSTLGAAQSSPLPDDFVYELATKVASYLDLDVEKLRKAMAAEGEKRRKQAELQAKSQEQALKAGQVAAVSGAVNQAAGQAKQQVKRDANASPARPSARAAGQRATA